MPRLVPATCASCHQYCTASHPGQCLDYAQDPQWCERLLQGPLETAKGTGTVSTVRLDFPGPWQSRAATTSFQPANFYQDLQSRLLGSVLLTAAQLPSTQTLLQDNPGLLPDGIVCVADPAGQRQR